MDNKEVITMLKINTINYGHIPVAKNDKWRYTKIIDTIQLCNGMYYNIKQTFNGVIVAIKAFN